MKRLLFAILTLLLLLIDPPAAAGAGEAAFFGRASIVGQGPQGTLKDGFEFGAGAEYYVRPHFAVGAGFGYARDDRHDADLDFELTSNVFEVHGRLQFSDARVHPYAEVGLGWYALRLSPEPGWFAGTSWKSDSAGGWLGAGAECPLAGPWAVRGGAAYHMIALDAALEGGDLGDYFTVGLTLQYRK